MKRWALYSGGRSRCRSLCQWLRSTAIRPFYFGSGCVKYRWSLADWTMRTVHAAQSHLHVIIMIEYMRNNNKTRNKKYCIGNRTYTDTHNGWSQIEMMARRLMLGERVCCLFCVHGPYQRREHYLFSDVFRICIFSFLSCVTSCLCNFRRSIRNRAEGITVVWLGFCNWLFVVNVHRNRWKWT